MLRMPRSRLWILVAFVSWMLYFWLRSAIRFVWDLFILDQSLGRDDGTFVRLDRQRAGSPGYERPRGFRVGRMI